ncbi:pcl6p [Saccharomyces arboricola H-6]|uniref:Pcl6p n=1 Tax=Saccharomyces arboricola (strain H-6 / AS 2.3317 / CBS 10644) TaxID=1160507 RepID=J8Q5V0_SACAR|nr:pcl6p [Saccharomyces arboricola H-6]
MSIKGDSPSSTNASGSPKSTYSIQSDDKVGFIDDNVETNTDNPQQDNNGRDIVVVTRVASDETLESQSSTSSMGIRPESSFNFEDVPSQGRTELNNRVHVSNMNNMNKYHPIRISKNSERQLRNDELGEANNLNEKVHDGYTVPPSTQEDKILDGDKSNPQITPSLNIADFPTDKLLKMLTALLTKIIKSNDRTAATNPSLTQEIENGKCLTLTDNEKKYLNPILGFRGKHVPQIGLDQYFQRIQKYCPTTNDVFLSLLVYFDRISKRCNSATTTPKFDAVKHGQVLGKNSLNKANKGSRCNSNENNENNDSDDENADVENNIKPHPQMFVMDSHNIHRLIIAGITVSTKFLSDFFYSNSRYSRVGGISLQELNHLELQFLVLCDFELLISVNELQRYADLLYRFWNNAKVQSQALVSSV